MDSPLPLARRRVAPVARIAQLAAMMLLVTSAFAAVPWLLNQDSTRPAFCDGPKGLQALLESGDFHLSTETGIADVIAFTRVTFRRGPCYGDCPVYRMVLYRDGQLELQDEAGVSHHGSISRATVIRVAQLLELAQAATTKREYLAQRTDSFVTDIAVTSRHGDWQVSDYGEVAPVEVWALEQVLHGIYRSTEWTAQPAQP